MKVCRDSALGLGLSLLVVLAAAAGNEEPGTYDYEGRLVHEGLPVSDVLDFEFRVFTARNAGAAVGPVLYADDVIVEDGAFFVTLDFGAFEFDEARHWLEVSVEGEPLLPRRLLKHTFELGRTAAASDAVPEVEEMDVDQDEPDAAKGGAPPAARSEDAGGAGFFDPDREGNDFIWALDHDGGPGEEGGGNGIWNTSGSKYYYNGGNVGIGTGNPQYNFDVRGERLRALSAVNRRTSGSAYGVFGRSDSPSGRGVFGHATAVSGEAYGVTGQTSSTTGRGVFGNATSETGMNCGVYGRTNSPEGQGVFGLGASASGTNYGVYGQTNSPDGFAGYFKGGVEVFEGVLSVARELDDRHVEINAGNVRLFGDAGTQTIRLDGSDGQIFASNDLGQITIKLEGDDDDAGRIDLTNDSSIDTVEIGAGDVNDAGYLTLRNAANQETVTILGADNNNTDGGLQLFDDSGVLGAHLSGVGALRLQSPVTSNTTVTLSSGGTLDAGQIGLSNTVGSRTLTMWGAGPSGVDRGAAIWLGGVSRAAAIRIEAEEVDSADSGSIIEMDADDQTLTIKLDSGTGADTATLLVDGTITADTYIGPGVTTEHGDQRTIYTPGATEPWLEDVGSGRLIAGEARIDLDPLYLGEVTIDAAHPMRVLITLTHDCNGVFVRKFDDHFIVKELNGGFSNAGFDYKVVCARAGHEGRRLEPFAQGDDRMVVEAAR